MKVTVFLVNTKYSSNIGSTARAMANMGVDDLVLISPQCEIDAQSFHAAAGASEALESTRSFLNFEDYFNFYKKPYLVGFSARSSQKFPRRDFKNILDDFKLEAPEHLGLVFGSEDNGFCTSHYDWFSEVAQLPLQGSFKSLNLSQAVLLALFYLQNQTLTAELTPLGDLDESLLKAWLMKLGYNLDSPKTNALKTLSRLFRRARPTPKECELLHSVIRQSLRYKEDT